MIWVLMKHPRNQMLINWLWFSIFSSSQAEVFSSVPQFLLEKIINENKIYLAESVACNVENTFIRERAISHSFLLIK